MIARHFKKEISLSLSFLRMQLRNKWRRYISERVTMCCIYLVSLSLPPPLSLNLSLSFSPRPFPRHGAHADGYVSLHFALALLLQVPRGPPAPSHPPSSCPSRRGVTMPSHSWHCYRYCYYYRYCCGRVANGKAEGQWSPAATLSAALEANYTHPLSPHPRILLESAYRSLQPYLFSEKSSVPFEKKR